jgi:hypothetical protein
MPAVDQEILWFTNRAQASEQDWQPMQRSMRVARNIFILFSELEYFSLVGFQACMVNVPNLTQR